MRAFRAIFVATTRQLSDRKKVLGFGALALAPALLLLALSRAGHFDGLDTDLGMLIVAPFLSMIVPITALILGGAAFGDERRDTTLSFLVLRPIRRAEIVAAKTAGAAAVSSGFAVFGSVTLVAAYVAVGGDFTILPALAVGGVVVATIYSAIFVLVGSVFARSTLVGVIYVLFVEGVMVDEVSRLHTLSLWRRGLGAAMDLMPETFPARALLGPLRGTVPSIENALLLTGGVLFVTIALGTVLLRRTDSV